MKKIVIVAITLIGISMVLSSCGEKEPDTIPVTGVSLDVTSKELVEGDSFTLTATITPNDATNKRVTWNSSNESVATVNNGAVTTHKAGTVSITVKTEDGNRTASCSVSVKEKAIPVTGVSLDKTSAEVTEGETLTLTATISPENATNKNVLWKSSDESIATVSNGKITGKKEGTVEITASVENVSAKCTITVNKKIIHVESISIATDKKRLKVGETYEIKCTIYPEDANNYELKFSSSDDSVAGVDSKGIITAKKSGKTIISVLAEDKSEDLLINVFRSDDIFYSYWMFDRNKYTSWGYHNDVVFYEATNLRVQDLFINNGNPLLVATEVLPSQQKATVIDKGNRYYLNDVDISKTNVIVCSTYANNVLYHIVNYPYPIVNGGYGIWEGFNKKYDITENGRLSDYSALNVRDLVIVGDDIYACGSISEPVDANTYKYFPVIWKNGRIHKKFESEVDSDFHQIVYLNGKIYLLMSHDVYSDYLSYISIWDENGKCYDIGTSYYASAGKLYCFDSKLYAVTVNLDENSSYSVLTVFEKDKELYKIDNVDTSNYALDYIDGDIYSLVIKREKIGGVFYYSSQIFRNDSEERVILKPQINALCCGGIKVLPKD